MTKKRSYPAEFREYITKLVVQDGRKIVDVCRELDIPYNTLQKWVARYRKELRENEKDAQNKLLTASEYKELYEAEFQAKLELQEENEILKKAMHIFTQEQE